MLFGVRQLRARGFQPGCHERLAAVGEGRKIRAGSQVFAECGKGICQRLERIGQRRRGLICWIRVGFWPGVGRLGGQRFRASFEEIEPRTFSFNSPYGACPACEGLGLRVEFDPDLI